jgi:hypothetical protein
MKKSNQKKIIKYLELMFWIFTVVIFNYTIYFLFTHYVLASFVALLTVLLYLVLMSNTLATITILCLRKD